jgi:hypothetical protein
MVSCWIGMMMDVAANKEGRPTRIVIIIIKSDQTELSDGKTVVI